MPKEDLVPDHTTIQIRSLYIVVRNSTSDQKACSFTGLTRTFERATIKLFTRPLTSFSEGMLSTNVILCIPQGLCLYAHSVLVSTSLHCGLTVLSHSIQVSHKIQFLSNTFTGVNQGREIKGYSDFSLRLPVHFFLSWLHEQEVHFKNGRKWTLLQQA